METSVKGMTFTYADLNDIAGKPFQEKCDWLKGQFANMRIPWYVLLGVFVIVFVRCLSYSVVIRLLVTVRFYFKDTQFSCFFFGL